MTLRVRQLSATGDMAFGQGSSNFLINSSATIAQIIGTRLRLWSGEWFLNLKAGVPYLQQILGKPNSVATAEMVLRAQILACPGVSSIQLFSASYDANTRTITINATGVQTIFSAQPFNITLPLPVPPG